MKVKNILMGYHPDCHYQNCNFNCCDNSGNCPTYSMQCYYYYSSNKTTELDAAGISGIVVGAIVALAIILVVARYCYQKKKQEKIDLQMRKEMETRANALGNSGEIQGFSLVYAQPVVPVCVQPMYDQLAYAQPVYGMPAYGQLTYAQPLGQPMMSQPTQGPIMMMNM